MGQRPAVERPDVEELEAHLRDAIADLETAGAGRGRGVPDRSEAAGQHGRHCHGSSPASTAAGCGGSSRCLAGAPERRRRGVAGGAACSRCWRRCGGAGRPADRALPGPRAGLAVPQRVAAGAASPGRLAGASPRAAGPRVVARRCGLRRLAPGVLRQRLSVRRLVRRRSCWRWCTSRSCCGSGVGYAYMGGAGLRSPERWMDFVRFTGEWFIYYVLIALGGGVLIGLTVAILQPSGVEPQGVVAWVLPSGAAGAVVIAAWLVEYKQQVIENMAPVLTMVFTPLFAVMLTVASAVYAVTGPGAPPSTVTCWGSSTVCWSWSSGWCSTACPRGATRGARAGWTGSSCAAVAAPCCSTRSSLPRCSAGRRPGVHPQPGRRAGAEPGAAGGPGGRRVVVAAVPPRAVRLQRVERWQTGYLPCSALGGARGRRPPAAVLLPLTGKLPRRLRRASPRTRLG